MDLHTFEGINTLMVMAVFIGICWWAYSAKRRKDNDEAAHLPFDDDEIDRRTLNKTENKK